ncbi:MAG: ABC transporter permease [Deinococcus sp.]|nr:ABC transporter permease [Deinococcus sp.]
MIERTFRPMWAFVFRDFHLTRRYISWVIVFVFYAIVNSATIALIGKSQNDFRLTLTLMLGALLWSFLSAMYNEIANSISYERWEGTLEYTFMAPVSRLIHLSGVSLFAVIYSVIRTIVILGGLVLFIQISLNGANLWGVLAVLLVASLAFMGLGLIAAILPVMSPENGAQATNIVQGVLLLVSGIYYPVSVLPAWVQPLAYLSPATYALEACRKLIGITNPASTPKELVGAPLSSVLPELGILLLMGIVLIPLGLFIFHQAELWAKRTGKLKRTG